MVRNQLTPKCNRSNRCSFTKTRPVAGFPSVINMPILCQYGKSPSSKASAPQGTEELQEGALGAGAAGTIGCA